MGLGMYSFGSNVLAGGPVGASVSGFEFFVGGTDLKDDIVEGSIQIDGAINERSIARFMLVNPLYAPSIGQIIQIRQDGVRLFGGTIDRVETKVNTNRNTIIYACECVDWQQFLDRRITTKTYTNQDAATIIRDLLDTVIHDEGVAIHTLESGITFPLVKAEEVRVGDLIRDVAEGAGFTYWIDPDRRLHFVRVSPDTAPFTLGAGTIVDPVLRTTREQYRNVQRVKVSGTPVADETAEEVTVERTDSTEIAARAAIEGGSGQYMVFDSLTHPSSNDTVELERLGQGFGKLRLTRSGAMRQVLRASTYTRGLAPGQLGTVDLPEHGVSGSWLITSLRTVREKVGRWKYELEAVLTSPFELAIDAYLRLVQAGRAIVQIPAALYVNLETFTIVGADTFTVPGSGNIDVEITTYGGSGGGGAYYSMGSVNGGAGGASGKAVTFITVPAGTVLDVTVGDKGAGGAVGASYTTVSTFNSSTTWTVPGSGDVDVEMTANGAGAGGGSSAWIGVGSGVFWTGGAGGAGGKGVTMKSFPAGTVLTINVGAAGGGGAGGASNTRNTGADGGASQVTDGGATVYAQGNGGGGGPYGQTLSGQPQGGNGSGSGDSITAGGGAAGGAPGSGGSEPGHVTNSGAGGSAGSVVIRYKATNHGTAGTLSKVEVAGVLKAQGDGGAGGSAGTDGGSAGTPGDATGDQTFAGGAFSGGVGGVVGTPDGSEGESGRVEIRY